MIERLDISSRSDNWLSLKPQSSKSYFDYIDATFYERYDGNSRGGTCYPGKMSIGYFDDDLNISPGNYLEVDYHRKTILVGECYLQDGQVRDRYKEYSEDGTLQKSWEQKDENYEVEVDPDDDLFGY